MHDFEDMGYPPLPTDISHIPETLHKPHHPHRLDIVPEFSDYLSLFYIIAAINGIGYFTSLSVTNSLDWYNKLNISFMNPPDWVFAPAWTILYTLMAIAVWKVILRRKYHRIAGAVTVFILQLILNYAWTILFFGMREPLWALADIVALVVLITVNIRLFIPIDKTASLLLMPYLLWVFFAAYLNAYIVMNN